MKSPNWTADEIEYLKQNWRKLPPEVVAANLGRPLRAAQVKASRLGFTLKGNVLTWSEEQIQFLKDNFHRMNSYQLAEALGKNRTKVRMKYKELGLSKQEQEYWSEEMVEVLLSIYRTTGNVEIAEIFEQRFPKNKRWTKNQIGGKMRNMKLKRTPAESKAIAAVNTAKGGRSYTIHKNSSVVLLSDKWIAQAIVGPRSKNAKELMAQVLKNPQLISFKRTQILLNRQIKQTHYDNSNR